MKTSKLAAEYRSSMNLEVLHSWAKDAVKEMQRLQELTTSSRETQDGPTLAAMSAIQFALEDEAGLDFLRCWSDANFNAIREEWPNAPEDVFLADELYQVNKT